MFCFCSHDNLFFFLAAASISGFSLAGFVPCCASSFHDIDDVVAAAVLALLSEMLAAYGRRDREGFVTNSTEG
jgi:hypothetical protein